jgi:uncharacterized protein YutE (UPF0331/DUF86 family)
MDEAYRDAILEHLDLLEEDLEQLRRQVEPGRPLSRIAYRAAERNLQLLIEACIGIAKQTLKARGHVVSADARQVLTLIASMGLDDSGLDWRRVIGMRNALVHDYLNFDPEIVLDILRSGRFQQLLSYGRQLLQRGQQQTSDTKKGPEGP